MKTSWSTDYLIQKLGARKFNEWRRIKQDELEEATGVPWTNYTLHCKVVFRPCWKKHPKMDADMSVKQSLMNVTGHHPFNATDFLSASKKTGLSLSEVIGITKTMWDELLIHPMTGRTGEVVGYYRQS